MTIPVSPPMISPIIPPPELLEELPPEVLVLLELLEELPLPFPFPFPLPLLELEEDDEDELLEDELELELLLEELLDLPLLPCANAIV